MPKDYGDNLSSYQHLSWLGNTTGTVLVKSNPARLTGIFVGQIGTLPAITIYDATKTATGTVIGTFVPTANTLYAFPDNITFTNGIYISGGTCNLTILYC